MAPKITFHETATTVHLSVSIPSTSLSQISFELFDQYLKINIPSVSFLLMVDFPYLVNYQSGYTSFVYQAPLLLIKLEKKEAVEWKALVQMKNKEIEPIRKESRARRDED